MQVPRAARWLVRGYSGFGIIAAIGFVIASFSPGLLPRLWLLQGAISGVLAAIGYGLGALLHWAARRLARLLELHICVGAWQRRVLQGLLILWVAASFAWSMVANIRSQAVTAQLLSLPPLSFPQWVGAFVVMSVVATLFITLGRLLRLFYRGVHTRAAALVPNLIAVAVGVVVVTAIAGLFTDLVLARGVLNAFSRAAASANAQHPDLPAPTSSMITGGPGSPYAWDSLGFEGQRFTALATKAATISSVTGRPAEQPIRTYAALPHDGDLQQAAAHVVSELHRTGAFDRKVLAVFTTTGTGWINEWSAQSLEFLSNGDCAIAAMQYSYLPSHVAFVADRQSPVEAGRALFDAVYTEWAKLPQDRRPQLVVSGESLGAYGGNSAFSGVDDMLTRAEGGVWSGTPRFTANIGELFATRLQGSPQISPVIDNGDHIRFVAGDRGLTTDYVGRPFEEWKAPRFVYIQHPSDPVVWWSPDLLFDQPAWLQEPRGADVNPTMHWLPVITFWQVTADMAVGLSQSAGHGHKYYDEEVGAWAAVLGLDPAGDWQAYADTIRSHINMVE
ncbi:MAG: alpha/beta hydrolase [Nostocoides sp.]